MCNNKNVKILYVGNNLGKSTGYKTTHDILSDLLISQGYILKNTSSVHNKFFRFLDMVLSLLRNIKNLDYVIIDTYSTLNFYYALVISQICRLFQIKYIPILHGGNLPYRIKKNKIMSSLIFSNSFRNIAPSKYLKTRFEEEGFTTTHISNAIPIINYKYKQRKKINPKILFVRAFAQIYNPELAINMFLKLRKVFPKASLCMVGPDKDGTLKKIIELVSINKLNNHIEITGVLSKDEWHNKSESYDIFINTSNIDNTPISVIEAMALGLTVVSTNVGGIPFLIENGVDGILINKNNPNQMANSIIELVNLNNTQLSSNARKKVENFDSEIVKEKWKKILA